MATLHEKGWKREYNVNVVSKIGRIIEARRI